MARILITGVGGQDGSYLAEALLSQGVHVTGVDRVGSDAALLRDLGILQRIELAPCDITDARQVRELLEAVRPTVVYHLAASSFVPDSWSRPAETTASGVLPIAALLEGIMAIDPSMRLVQACSAEVFGRPAEVPQTEQTSIVPVSPYGATKAYGLFLGRMYRERFGLSVSTAIMYNHESPRRPERFVTRKITRAAAEIAVGLRSELTLGSLDVERDWSFAGDIVNGIVLMAEAEGADDFILASGQTRTVEAFLEAAFGCVALDWRDYVVQDPDLVRPGEPARMCGDPSKAERRLGWNRSTSFEKMVAMMVEHDLAEVRSRA